MHDVDVMVALDGRDIVFVELDSSFNAGEEGSERWEPAGFDVWEVLVNVSKYWLTES